MSFVNRFQFDSLEDPALVLDLLTQSPETDVTADDWGFLDEPNRGCVGDYSDANDSDVDEDYSPDW